MQGMLQSSSLELLEAFAHSGSSSSTSVGGAELAQQRLRRYGAWDRNGNGRVGVNHLGLHDGYDMRQMRCVQEAAPRLEQF